MSWLAALKELHKLGADLNASYRNYRALHSLIQEKPSEGSSGVDERVECLQWMLEQGADPQLTGSFPPTRATLIATFSGERKYVDLLLKYTADISFHLAAALGDIARMKKMVAADAALVSARDEDALLPLHCCGASKMGQNDLKTRKKLLECATFLLDSWADPNATVRGWSYDVDVAYFVIGSKQTEMLKLLLKRGADTEQALPACLWRADYEMAELVLEYGGNPDLSMWEGKPALNQFVRWGQIDQALWMLEHGASPNRADERGWTAVHQAASRGNERVMKALLKAGGDTSARDNSGWTPAQVARSQGKSKMVDLLD